MKRFKILAVIAIIALAGGLLMACGGGDSDGGGGGTSPVSGWQGGSRPGGTGNNGKYPGSSSTITEDTMDNLNKIRDFLEGKGITVGEPDRLGHVTISGSGNAITIDLTGDDFKDNRMKFKDPVIIDKNVTIIVRDGKTIEFFSGLNAKNVTSDGGGTIQIGYGSDIEGTLTVTKGEVVIGYPGDDEKFTVTIGDVTKIDDAGVFTVHEAATVELQGDTTISGNLNLDGTLVVASGATLTLCAKNVPYDADDPPTRTSELSGSGTIDVSGDMIIQANSSNDDAQSPVLDRFKDLAEGSLVFHKGSTLTFQTVSGWGPPYNNISYPVIAAAGGEGIYSDPDIALKEGKITVLITANGRLKLVLEEDDDDADSASAEAEMWGYFPVGANATIYYDVKEGDGDLFFIEPDLDAGQFTTIDYEFVVSQNSTLTIMGQFFLIQDSGKLTIDAGSEDDDDDPGKVVVFADFTDSVANFIVNRGIIANSGEIETVYSAKTAGSPTPADDFWGTIVNGGTLTSVTGSTITNAGSINYQNDGNGGRIGTFNVTGVTYSDGEDSTGDPLASAFTSNVANAFAVIDVRTP